MASPAAQFDSQGFTRASIADQSAVTSLLPGAAISDGRSIPLRTSVTRLPWVGTIWWPRTMAWRTASGSLAVLRAKLCN